MSDTYQIIGTFAGAEQIVAKYKEIEKAIKGVDAANKALGRTSNQTTNQGGQGSSYRTRQHREEAGAIMKVAEAAHKYRIAMRETREIVRSQVESFIPFKEGAETLARAEMQFRSLNLSANENAEAFKVINDIVKNGKNTYADLTGELQNLHAAFGDLHHAMEFLPTAAKTEYVFSALFGKNPQETQANILSTMRALEQMGALRGTGPKDSHGIAQVTEADMDRLKQYYDTVIQMQVMTKGLISGQDLQSFVATGGVAAKQLSPEGLRNMTFIIQEMKGGRAGTGLMAMFQSFRAFRQGAGGQRSFDTMAELGLVKPRHELERQGLAEFSKEGRIKKLLPGAVPVADLLAEDPVQFATAIHEALIKNGDKVFGTGRGRKKFDPMATTDVALALSQITGSKTSMNELATMILQISQIQKDSANVKKSMTQDELNKMVDESPLGKLKKWEVALENFRQKAGLPLIEVLGQLATAGQPFLEFLGQHPKLAFWTLAGFKATTTFFELSSVLRQFQMLKAISQFNSLSTAALGASQNVAGVTSSVKGASALGSTLRAGLYVGLIISLEELARQAIETDDAMKDMNASAKTALDSYNKLEELKKGKGEKVPAQITANAAAGAIEALKVGGESKFGLVTRLKDALENNFSLLDTARNPFSMISPLMHLIPRDNVGAATEILKDRARELSNPEIMEKFIEKVNRGAMGLSDTGKENLMQALAKAFPQAFEQATQSLKIQEEAAANALISKLIPAINSVSTELFSFKVPNYAGGEGATGESGPRTKKKKGFFDGLTLFPQSSNAAGGLTRRDHLAFVHQNEYIIPRQQAQDWFARDIEGGGGVPSVTQHFELNLYGIAGPNIAPIKSAVQQVIAQSKHELNKAMTTHIKDRKQSAG